MNALILSILLAASGDPYARCRADDDCGLKHIALSAGQRTAIINHITSQPEWSSITPGSITKFECQLESSPAKCRPWHNVTVVTGEDVKLVLAALGRWDPGVDDNTYLIPGAWKYYAGTNLTAAITHINNVAPETAGLPLLAYVVSRTNGSGVLYADVGFKAVADNAWCLAHIDQTIVMDGTVP